MNTRILTIIFSTLAAMFKELNSLILSGCEVDPPLTILPDAKPGTAGMIPDDKSAAGIIDAAAILSGAPVTGSTPPVLQVLPGQMPGAAGTARLDSEGIPWDARIHSSGKTFYKSKAANGAPEGSWKLKKGVDAVTVAQIKTELAGGYVAPPGGVTMDQTAPGTVGPGETTETCTDIYTWASLVEIATAAGITPQIMTAACNKYNIPGIIELQDQALLIPAVAKELGLST